MLPADVEDAAAAEEPDGASPATGATVVVGPEAQAQTNVNAASARKGVVGEGMVAPG
jgi:hypothetical protein